MWKDVPHVVQAYAGLLDEPGAALDLISDFLPAQLAPQPSYDRSSI
jgi:hypothetical protein